MTQPQWEPYEYPELDVKEYNKKLEALLWRRFYAGQLAIEGKTLKPNEKNMDKATNYINNLVRQTISEGVNPRLPFYNEIITATMTPEWYQGQVGQYQQDWAQWGEEQSQEAQRQWQREFGVQQWQQSEAWRRYGAETQQQRWQAEQQAQRRQQLFDWRQQREITRQAQYNWGQQRMAHQFRTGGGEDIGGQRAGQASLWEAWNARLASQATWPQSEIYETRENPYAPREESIGDLMQQSKAEYEFAKEKADWFRKRMKDPDDTLTRPTGFLGSEQVPATMGDMTPDQMAAQGAFVAEEVAWKQLGDLFASQEGRQWGEWKAGQEKQRGRERELGWGETWGRDLPPKQLPPMPKTPEFLREVYPELGERLPRKMVGGEEAPMGILSGQQWGRWTPSQRGKWAGYVGWASGKPERAEELYGQMQQMIPRYRAGTRWAPARQRA